MPMPSLADVAHEAAAGRDIVAYLEDRGIRTSATLALMATEADQLQRVVIDPLLNGWKKGDGSMISIPEIEKPIAAAILSHMHAECRRAWVAQQTTSVPIPSPTPSGGSGSGTTKTSEDKAPKQLPQGIWSQLLNNFQSQQLHGKDRIFPTQEILGADAVIARVWWEHTHSKLYSPVQLGEVLQARTFQASGEVNPLAKPNRSSTKLTIADNELVQENEPVWNPRSVLAIIDGLNSVRWTYIFTGLGEEVSVNEWFDWLIRLCRSRPAKTDQMAQFYLMSSWKLCMDLRSGKSFEESTKVLMRDYDAFTECMSREPAVKKDTNKSKQTTPYDTPSKGHGKSKTKDKGKRYQPYYDNRPRDDRPWRSQGWNYNNKWQSDDRPHNEWRSQSSQK